MGFCDFVGGIGTNQKGCDEIWILLGQLSSVPNPSWLMINPIPLILNTP